VPIARYFIFVGGTLAALLLIASCCLPTPPAMFAKQLVVDRSTIRIKSARKWPEKVVLDTSQPTITPPAVEEPPADSRPGYRLTKREINRISRLSLSCSQIQRRLLSIIRPCASSAVWQGPLDRSVWPDIPLYVGWQERKRAGAVVSLDGSIIVKQSRTRCRARTPRRHGLWIERRSQGGIERYSCCRCARNCAVTS
jgi:hypothetical protein